jgi:glycosyltransferase involved in cell wall biosynthesis
VSRILLVAQSTRSYGEFRRPWVRAVYRRYVARYRDRLARAAARLAREGDLTVLVARELLDEARLPPGVRVHYYDEESFKVDSESLARLTRRLTGEWWPSPEAAPELVHGGVWLPDLLSVVRAIVLRAEVVEPLGIAERVWRTATPTRLVLLSGASVLERLCSLLAARAGVPVEVAARGFVAAHLYARAVRALQPREERLRLREFLDFPRRGPRSAVPGAARRLLFVTCRPRHHFVIDPLTQAARSAGAEPRVISTPTRDAELASRLDALAKAGVGADYLSDYLPRADARRLVRRYRPLVRALWRRIEAGPELSRILEHDGLRLDGVARPILRDSVERTLLVARLFQEAAGRALDALAPAAVVVTSNRRYCERALALGARARGIPCLLFSGTLVMGRDRGELFDIGDRMLVIGEHLRERLTAEEGVAGSRVSVVGDPRSNAARLLPPAELRRQVLADFGLTAGKPLLVFLSKYVSLLFSGQEKEAFYRTMVEALPALGRPHVIIKVHPNEDLRLLAEQVHRWGWPDALLTKEYDIHRLLGAADAAIMVTSMAGLEAMALDCPVVALQVAGKDYEGEYMPPYASEGVVERVAMGDAAELVATLRRLLDEPDHRQALVERGRKFAARYVHPVDGALGERLLSVVDDVEREMRGGRVR